MLELVRSLALLERKFLHVIALLLDAAVEKLGQLECQAVVFRVIARVFLILIEHVHQCALAQQKSYQVLLLLLH